MIVVDTSIWIDHLDSGDLVLQTMLEQDRVITHPFILGEIALGHVRNRDHVLKQLRQIRQCSIARDEEVMSLIAQNKWFGKGIGYIDAHLIASTLITSGARFWTRDRRLAEIADSLQIEFQPKVN